MAEEGVWVDARSRDKVNISGLEIHWEKEVAVLGVHLRIYVGGRGGGRGRWGQEGKCSFKEIGEWSLSVRD